MKGEAQPTASRPSDTEGEAQPKASRPSDTEGEAQPKASRPSDTEKGEAQPKANTEKWNVGIMIFDGVEVLDFAGPFEVFSRTRLAPGPESRRSDEAAPFNVFTVARSLAPVVATGGLKVLPHHDFAGAPRIDLLLVPGGFGTRALINDAEALGWIRDVAAKARKVTSVCTGSLLLAQAGLLQGRRATTHWGALDMLESLKAGVTVERKPRVVDDGIISSAGVASGMDMAFYVVETMFGRAVADETAHYIEYRRAGNEVVSAA
jgi:transcriptional regulator GlxA family with amidase domain